MLGTAQDKFNSVTTLALTSASLLAGDTAATNPKMLASVTNGFLASAAYKTSVVYPVATVKGASSLAMTLAAATVLATLF